MSDDAIVLFSSMGVGLVALLERFRLTIHPPNPWTLEGIVGVLSHMHQFDHAAEMVSGKVVSCFRSERVNQLVGGSPTSDHLAGRAVDIVSSLHSHKEAAQKIFSAVERGELGHVREVLEEPTCVHVGWYPIDAPIVYRARLGKWRM